MMVFLMCATIAASAQQTKITGTVKGPGGEPLIGASVRVDKSTKGTVTDIDGNYAIEATTSSNLVFSYIGYETKNEKVGDRRVINVTLEEKSDLLNEVVVIGYGTMDKKELTSAISHVGEKDFLTVSSLDPSMMIQGKVPGISAVDILVPSSRSAAFAVITAVLMAAAAVLTFLEYRRRSSRLVG